MPQQTYCTSAHVAFILSDVGLTMRIDDDESGVASVEEEARTTTAISWSAAEINGYLPKRYFPLSALSGNIWLTMANALMACEWICQRRNNPVPEVVGNRVRAVREMLEMIRWGRMPLPEQHETHEHTPSVSNFRVVPGSINGPILVSETTSVGSPPVAGVQQFTSYYRGYF